MKKIDPDMTAHYDSGVEAERLGTWGRLEFVRTMELLGRYLPSPPSVVVDVGGGAGAYAIPLAAKGYEVHLLDPMPLHVKQARSASDDAEHGLASAAEGEARALPMADGSIDVVLLLGPLYHLTELDDRLAALAEARRVLRPGGLVVAAAISRFASTYDGIASGFLANPEFRKIVERDVRDGQHRNPTRHPRWFTTSYFHHPEGLRKEILSAGLQLVALVGVEGPAAWLPDIAAWLDDPDRREVLLEAIRRVESEPTLLGASAHLIAVAARQ